MIAVETFSSNDQASSALNNDSRFLAGGTLVMRALNYGEQDFTRIVRSTDPAMKQITNDGNRIVIGAGVTMSEVIRSRELEFLTPVAKSIGGPAVRSMATVGGNLFANHPYGDFTVALLALGGSVQIAGGSDKDLEGFLGSRNTEKQLVSSVTISKPSSGDFYWKKVSRVKPKGVSVMSIAAWLPQTGGRVSGAKIAFGAMGPTPLRAKGVEAALEGKPLEQSSIEAACAAIQNDLQPQDDPLASSWYRTQVAPVHLQRLLSTKGGM